MVVKLCTAKLETKTDWRINYFQFIEEILRWKTNLGSISVGE